MNTAIELDDFDNTDVYFKKSVRNTVIDESNFLRVTYSNNMFSMNGIYIIAKIFVSYKEKHYNKYKCYFDVDDNQVVIDKLIQVEKEILERLEFPGKTPVYKIRQQLNIGHIKIFTENSGPPATTHYIIKMSGVWETDAEYGITYKFINVSSVIRSNHLLKKTREPRA